MITVYRVRLGAAARSGSADAALHAILVHELGEAPEIARDGHGKPYLVGRELAFNVAHSGELAVIAIARGGVELGVDVEEHRDRIDVTAVARRFFTAAEAAAVAAEPRQFFRLWCRKEAWLKARGTGLVGLPLSEVDMRVGAPPGWFLEDLAVGDGYSGAVACSAAGPVAIIDC